MIKSNKETPKLACKAAESRGVQPFIVHLCCQYHDLYKTPESELMKTAAQCVEVLRDQTARDELMDLDVCQATVDRLLEALRGLEKSSAHPLWVMKPKCHKLYDLFFVPGPFGRASHFVLELRRRELWGQGVQGRKAQRWAHKCG